MVFLIYIALALGILIYTLILIIPALKGYSNKNFNNHRNWVTQPCQNVSPGFKRFFTQTLLDPKVVKLEQDEGLLAHIDFAFYHFQFLEGFFNKVMYLTDKRLILVRLSFFWNKMKCKSIPFSDIENVEIKWMIAWPYVRLYLKSGEIYQITPNLRLGSKKRMDDYKKIMEFLKTMHA